jgi:hypothetical protein
MKTEQTMGLPGSTVEWDEVARRTVLALPGQKWTRMALASATDDELNVAFSVDVAGWKSAGPYAAMPVFQMTGGSAFHGIHQWTNSFDLVWPFMERITRETGKRYHGECMTWNIYAPGGRYGDQWAILPFYKEHDGATEYSPVFAKTLGRAAVMVCLLARSVPGGRP